MQEMHYRPLNLPNFSEPSPDVLRTRAEEEKKESAPPEPETPNFSEEELLAAQKEAEALGFEKGRAQGVREAESANAKREEQLTTAVQAFTARLEAELDQLQQQNKSQQEEVAALIRLAVQKLTGTALEQLPLAPIEPMVGECLTMLAGEARIDIYVAADLAPLLEEKLAARPAGDRQVIKVMPDTALQVGDCRVEWQSGKAERNHETLWAEIDGIISRSRNDKKAD